MFFCKLLTISWSSLNGRGGANVTIATHLVKADVTVATHLVKANITMATHIVNVTKEYPSPGDGGGLFVGGHGLLVFDLEDLVVSLDLGQAGL